MSAIRYKSTPGTGNVKLKLSKIKIDGGTQSRAGITNLVVAEYAEAMREGAIFPPLIVFYDGSEYWLADGFHRFHGLEMNGETEAAADVRQGTCRDAILFSVGANSNHGLRRTNDDKRRAVKTLLGDEEWSKWSDGKVAEKCGVSREFVNRMRSDTCDPITSMDRTFIHPKTGEPTTMKTAAIGRPLGAGEKSQTTETVAPSEPEFDPMAVRSIRDGLSPEVQVIEEHKATSRSAKKLTAEQMQARIEELEESQKSLEQDYADVLAENKKLTDIRVQIEQGGVAEVLEGKDEEISVLRLRVSSESEAKATWMGKAKFWKKKAIELGYRDSRFDEKREQLPDDDPFFDVVGAEA